MDKQEIAANLVHDFQLIERCRDADVDLTPALVSYALSCILVNRTFDHDELERGVIVDGYRISINYALAGDPLKIERVQ